MFIIIVFYNTDDPIGECRAHGNLGAAYFSQGNYKEALTHHRFQLVLAMKQKDRNVAASALSSLGKDWLPWLSGKSEVFSEGEGGGTSI